MKKYLIDIDIVVFRERFQNVLKYKGWSQAELSRRAKISKRSISRWMKKDTPPSLGSITKIAEAAGANPRYLQGQENTMILARDLTYAESSRFWIGLSEITDALGWSIKQLSRRTGIFEESILLWKNKKVAPCDEDLTRIAEATGCRREWLLTWNGEKWQIGKEPEKEGDKLKAADILVKYEKLLKEYGRLELRNEQLEAELSDLKKSLDPPEDLEEGVK